MKQSLLLLLLFFTGYLNAQDVKAYGVVTYRQNPSVKVQIALFENDSLVKKTYSDKKGKFHIRLSEKKTYVLFFYKPAFDIYAYKIINRLDQDLQNIFIEVQLKKSKEAPDSIFMKSPVIKSMNPTMYRAYKMAIDNYLKEKKAKSAASLPSSPDSLIEFTRQDQSGQVHVYQTKKGTDIYERTVDVNRQTRYMKNEKPITEVTYNFETQRRNEGVIKKYGKVKNHSRYKSLRKK